MLCLESFDGKSREGKGKGSLELVLRRPAIDALLANCHYGRRVGKTDGH